MVNSEAFTKRLKIITDYYAISASVLADKMEVPRSSISHILSGRNKPSLDFVMKILKAFPEVDLYWLLNGVGTFPKGTAAKKEEVAPIVSESKPVVKTAPEKTTPSSSEEKQIERIVVFYKDGTFKNYIP